LMAEIQSSIGQTATLTNALPISNTQQMLDKNVEPVSINAQIQPKNVQPTLSSTDNNGGSVISPITHQIPVNPTPQANPIVTVNSLLSDSSIPSSLPPANTRQQQIPATPSANHDFLPSLGTIPISNAATLEEFIEANEDLLEANEELIEANLIGVGRPLPPPNRVHPFENQGSSQVFHPSALPLEGRSLRQTSSSRQSNFISFRPQRQFRL